MHQTSALIPREVRGKKRLLRIDKGWHYCEMSPVQDKKEKKKKKRREGRTTFLKSILLTLFLCAETGHIQLA